MARPHASIRRVVNLQRTDGTTAKEHQDHQERGIVRLSDWPPRPRSNSSSTIGLRPGGRLAYEGGTTGMCLTSLNTSLSVIMSG